MGTNADEDPQEKLTGYGCVRRVHILLKRWHTVTAAFEIPSSFCLTLPLIGGYTIVTRLSD